jgi:DNA modification methylase
LGLEPTPELYVEHMVEIFREVNRVLRDDGTLWLNLGDSYAGGGRNSGRPDDYRSKQDTNRGNTSSMGDRGLVPPGLKSKDLVGVPWRVAFALQAAGWYLRSDVIWSKPNPMPESVSDRPTKSHEYVFLLSKRNDYYYDPYAIREVSSELPAGNSERRIAGENDPARLSTHIGSSIPYQPNGTGRNRRSVWTITTKPFPEAHFATFPEDLPELCIKAGTSEHGACSECGAPYERMLEKGEPLTEQQRACGGDADGEYDGEAIKDYGGTGAQDPSDVKRRILEGMVSKRTIGWKPTCRCMESKVQACVVLDPFAGAGTTGLVADRLGRDFVGIELNEEYREIARRRIKRVAPMFDSEVPA